MSTISLLKKTALLPGIFYLANLSVLVLLSGNPSFHIETSPWKVLGDLIWILGQFGVLLTLHCLYRLDLNGNRAIHKFALLIPACGALSYIIGTIWNTGLILSFFDLTPMLIFFPVGAFLSAVGMVWVGIQIARTKDDVWFKWHKFTGLTVGLYPFTIMFPVVIITGQPNVYLIMLWGLPWLLFGLSLKKVVCRIP